MNVKLLFVHALAPLHPGTGQGVGVIDLPIAREVSTGLPFLPGSSVKGTLRDSLGSSDERLATLLFGPPTNSDDERAGSAQFADQRLLLLPVRSLRGTFAWATSPYLLHRFAREARETGADCPAAIPAWAQVESCLVAEQNDVLISTAALDVTLEDLDLKATRSAAVSAWADWLGQRLFPNADAAAGQESLDWRSMLAGRLCVVHDDVLLFLLDTATEIRARVQLDAGSKTVAKGGLWYEEALPAETVLAGLVAATPIRQRDDPEKHTRSADAVFEALRPLMDHTLQFGGKATVGRGICRVLLG